MTEKQKILRFCQAKIFRDIWRITDQETALQMCFMLEDGMDTAPSAETPKLRRAAELLRLSSDPLKRLEDFAGTSLTILKIGEQRRKKHE